MKDFEPFRSLWTSVSEWLKTQEMVMNDPLNSVDAEHVERMVSDCYRVMHKSVKHFAELTGVSDVCNQIKMAIEEFKPFIPLIQGLRNPGMRSRHWELLSQELGINLVPKATLTFAKCLEMQLQVSKTHYPLRSVSLYGGIMLCKFGSFLLTWLHLQTLYKRVIPRYTYVIVA
ncbi:unnamed protein product [Protopolystoma xenopodis]|uniref:Dynein heavy chain linker domain-containing protein n=1 Tax=Protopolystoma xenopodis TaxID=117903 RepID=A0A3S5A335_9PLAT|nr:unnamed protein product [Protopolystoma xenopodis]